MIDYSANEKRLMQERDRWKDEALRLRENNEALRRELGIAKASARQAEILREENEALRKRLDSATEFVFHRHGTKSMEFNKSIRARFHSDNKWSICYIKEGSVFSVFPDGKNVFDTIEEAEAAARKALEVAG